MLEHLMWLIEVADKGKSALAYCRILREHLGLSHDQSEEILKLAKDKAEAKIIAAKSDAEVKRINMLSEIEQRALGNLPPHDAEKQKNKIDIIRQGHDYIAPNTSEETMKKVDKDFYSRFFRECETISDEKMQTMWAKILGSEMSAPGSFSKRTVVLVGAMDKEDAEMFTHFCQFVLNIGNNPNNDQPLIYDYQNKIYNTDNFRMYDVMQHLDAIGLISYSEKGRGREFPAEGDIFWLYHGNIVYINFSPNEDNKRVMKTGSASLTQAGKELFLICGAEKNDKFFEYIMKTWEEMGYNPSLTPHEESDAK